MIRQIVLFSVIATVIPSIADDGFVSLFNGENLSQWKGDPELWTVEDGAITGRTRGPDHLEHNSFLVWQGGAVRNFELRLEFRMEGDNNSGVQYRSQHLRDQGKWIVGGYQADIHANPAHTGALYEERGRGVIAQRGQQVVVSPGGRTSVKLLDVPISPINLEHWHELTIVARERQLTHEIDGVTTADITDDQLTERDEQGIIAFQLHRGPAMKVQFRNIRLRDLSKFRRKPQQEKKPSTNNKPDHASPAATNQPAATPIDSLKIAEGFRVELLYSVPNRQQGSWVAMCVDPRGRMIVSDQGGSLYRVTPPPIETSRGTIVERIDLDIGGAQGLLWAFDSLYVCGRGPKHGLGIYRVRDTDDDDQLDSWEFLRELVGGGEHGPHSVVLAPDGESLFIVCGNQTQLTGISESRVPRVWDEDLLLPRAYGIGFMQGVPAPGGFIIRIDPDGKHSELIAVGFRNEFDAALNADGELFTFDADMEGDINSPWYRPTRVCHVVSGAEFGWRNGAGKWPVYYPDSVPPVVNIGPGSPTGICFGYGAQFPPKYQNALFASDWSYGKLYAIHLEPDGATYRAKYEEFITGTPLPLTDIVVNPRDGAMYFAIGGRGVQSGLYRVTHTERGSFAPGVHQQHAGQKARAKRRQLELLHSGDHLDAVETAWPHLGDSDRFIRYASRVAVEHRPVREWQARALQETQPQILLTSLLALARQFPRPVKGTGANLDAPAPRYPSQSPRHPLQPAFLAALNRLVWSELTDMQRIELLRVYSLAFLRLGPPDEAARIQLIAELDAVFPSEIRELNSELAQMLVYLQAPNAAAKTMNLLKQAPTQEEQIDYARTLRHLHVGWSSELRKQYFEWFIKAARYRGGLCLARFVENIKEDVVATLSDAEKESLKQIIEAKPAEVSKPMYATPRDQVKLWTLPELVPIVEQGLVGRDFSRGRRMFGVAQCFACHRFDNQGGAMGPDLTGLSGRFNTRDLLESIVKPNKVISDQYAAVTITTNDGRVLTGRIINLFGDVMYVNTDMRNTGDHIEVKRGDIEEMLPAKTSMMPSGLLNTLKEDEILDLMAYLLSRGQRNHTMFKTSAAR